MKKNKLYTANKKNLFALGDQLNPKVDRLASQYFGAEKYGTDGYTAQDYLNTTNKLGLTKAANPFSKANIGSTASSVLSGIGGAGNQMLLKGIGGGYSTGGAGDTVAGVTNTIGGALSAIPGIGGAIGGAVQLVGGAIGGLVNRTFGMKTDQAALDAANQGTNTLRNFSSNASSFDEVQGPEAVANIGTVYKGGWAKSARKKAAKKNAALVADRDAALSFADRSVDNNIDNLVNDQYSSALANYAAFGGPLFDTTYNMDGAIGYEFMSDYLNNKKQQTQDKSKLSNLFMGTPSSMFDFGGTLQTHGGDFSTGLTHIKTGGTHEENPYDGVQMGVDNEGTPNLVEEGETIFNDYVFSNRILADEATKKLFHLPKKKEITFADISKRLEKEIAERPNDPISQAGFKAQMQSLQDQQERQKQEMEAKRARAAFEALSPEEQTAVMQQLAQREAMEQQAVIPPINAEGATEMPKEARMQQQVPVGEAVDTMAAPQMQAMGGRKYTSGGPLLDTIVEMENPTMGTFDGIVVTPKNNEKETTLQINPLAFIEAPKRREEEEERYNRDRRVEEYLDRLEDWLDTGRRNKNKIHYYAPGGEINNKGEWYPDSSVAFVAKLLGLDENNYYKVPSAALEVLHRASLLDENKNATLGRLIESTNSALYNVDNIPYYDSVFSELSPEQLKEVYNAYIDSTRIPESNWVAKQLGFVGKPLHEYVYRNTPLASGMESLHDVLERVKDEDKNLSLRELEGNYFGTTLPLKEYLETAGLLDKPSNTLTSDDWMALKDIYTNSQKTDSQEQGVGVASEKVEQENPQRERISLKDRIDRIINNISRRREERKARRAAYREDRQQSREERRQARLEAKEQDRIEKEQLHQLRTLAKEEKAKQKVLEKQQEQAKSARVQEAKNAINPDSQPRLSVPDSHLPIIQEPTNTSNGDTELFYNNGVATPLQEVSITPQSVEPLIGLQSPVGLGFPEYNIPHPSQYQTRSSMLAPLSVEYSPLPLSVEDSTRPEAPIGVTPGYLINPDLTPEGAGDERVTNVHADTDSERVEPKHRAEWLRYAGLFGPAVGLGMMAAGVGRPDKASLDAAISGAGDVTKANYQPIGNYLTYRPMDIWFEQNRMDANARATDRAIMNSSSPSRMAGLLANGYNSQIANGELYRKALEYNDALQKQVADFNRGTDMFNAEAYTRNSQFNADASNRTRQQNAQLRLAAAREKMDADAGWYNSLYGNISGLFKGLGDLGTEDYRMNRISEMAADGVFGNLGKSNTGSKWIKKKSKGGKVNKKRGLTF